MNNVLERSKLWDFMKKDGCFPKRLCQVEREREKGIHGRKWLPLVAAVGIAFN